MTVLRDSRGNPSRTLEFVAVAFAAITVRFCMSGFYGLPVISLGDYGTAFVLIVAPYIGREWVDKTAKAKGGSNES